MASTFDERWSAMAVENERLQRRLAELEVSEERHRLLIERMGEGFVASDDQNRMQLVNAKWVAMIGYPAEQQIGRWLGEFTDAANQQILASQESSRRHAIAEPYELSFVRSDGERILTLVSPSSLIDQDGRYRGSFAVIHDVTAERRAEEERLQLEVRIQDAQRLESLGLMAGGVAHDFNNLLVGIIGHANLASLDLPADSPALGSLQRIETAAIRAAELTQEMLTYSGRGKQRIERVDISALVAEMVKLMAIMVGKKIRLEVRTGSTPPMVEGDPTQLRQVTMNLLTNAAEAIGDREGDVRIETGVLKLDRPYVSDFLFGGGLAAGAYAFCEVVDSGCGMDGETRRRMFDPFFTTKFTGRGLGLAAVLGIIRGHAGAIEVESQLGRGTRCRVLFPVSAETSGVTAAAPSAEMRPIESMPDAGCVLVVDDEEMVRRIVGLTLERAGFRVLEAADGYEALEVFSRRADEITLVVLDVIMPRLGGEETLLELRRLRPGIKVLLTSGYNERESILRATSQGSARFLQKPFQPQTLLEVVHAILGRAV
jgi:two-component system cell cycle sensor histidine kinase/response regulator CckA